MTDNKSFFFNFKVTEREDLNPEAEAEALKNALDGCGQ